MSGAPLPARDQQHVDVVCALLRAKPSAYVGSLGLGSSAARRLAHDARDVLSALPEYVEDPWKGQSFGKDAAGFR